MRFSNCWKCIESVNPTITTLFFYHFKSFLCHQAASLAPGGGGGVRAHPLHPLPTGLYSNSDWSLSFYTFYCRTSLFVTGHYLLRAFYWSFYWSHIIRTTNYIHLSYSCKIYAVQYSFFQVLPAGLSSNLLTGKWHVSVVKGLGKTAISQPEDPGCNPRPGRVLNFEQPSFATPSVDRDVKPLV